MQISWNIFLSQIKKNEHDWTSVNWICCIKMKQFESLTYKLLWFHLSESTQEWKQTIPVHIFKGCLPQILLGPFLNILSHLSIANLFMGKNFQITFYLHPTSTWKNQLLLRCSWFTNLKFWLAESFFDHAQMKMYKPPFTFLESRSAWQK